MTPNNRLAALAVAAILLLASPAAFAAVATAASFDDKVDNASAIVLGRVIRTQSQFDATGRWIVTYSTFAVEKAFKGSAMGELTLVTPGGSVNGIHQATVGVPAFQQGDEHVVFVKDTKSGPTVLYFDQGTYDVTRDAKGDRIIAPVPSNVVTVDTQRGMAVAPADEPRTLKQFERAVGDSLRTSMERKQKMAATPSTPAQQRPTTLIDTLAQNKLLFALAMLGIALAAWQLWKR
jgi:hypothetical protein